MDSIEIKVPGLAGVVLKRRGPSSYMPPVVEEPKAAPKKRTSLVKPKPAAAKKLLPRPRPRLLQSPLLRPQPRNRLPKRPLPSQVCFC